MAFHVRDPVTDLLVRKLARIKRMGLTETVREAVEREYQAVTTASLRTIQADFRAMRQASGKPADKAFLDDLSGHG